jgi:hypothetical protein
MLKRIAGLFIIILVISIGGVSASMTKELTPYSYRLAMENFTETPLPHITKTEANSSLEVIVSYIQSNFNGKLTDPEVGCLLNYYDEQLSSSSML